MLTQKQFDILVYLADKKEYVSQRVLAEELQLSVGTINKTLKELANQGFLNDGMITDEGYKALEPYRVQRAVFMAAGFGSRLVPITLNTPKPLVRVKGKRMIDTLLDAVIAAEIPEIYIVRGYLGEQFEQLLSKYPMIKFIDNPMYNEANNIASLLCAGDLIKNAYVLEADLVLSNPKLITKYQYRSNYLAIPAKRTDDWCFHLENGIIKKIGIGGENCHQIVGISYWTGQDGAKLAKHIKAVYDSPGGKECYISQVPFVRHAGEYEVTVRECTQNDIVEVDTFRELKEIDPHFDV